MDDLVLVFGIFSEKKMKKTKQTLPPNQDSKIGGVSVVVLGQGVQLGRAAFFFFSFSLGRAP
jgi:hypothetical protein